MPEDGISANDTSTEKVSPAFAFVLPTDICTVSPAAATGASEQTESESIAAKAPTTTFFVFIIFSSFFNNVI